MLDPKARKAHYESVANVGEEVRKNYANLLKNRRAQKRATRHIMRTEFRDYGDVLKYQWNSRANLYAAKAADKSIDISPYINKLNDELRTDLELMKENSLASGHIHATQDLFTKIEENIDNPEFTELNKEMVSLLHNLHDVNAYTPDRTEGRIAGNQEDKEALQDYIEKLTNLENNATDPQLKSDIANFNGDCETMLTTVSYAIEKQPELYRKKVAAEVTKKEYQEMIADGQAQRDKLGVADYQDIARAYTGKDPVDDHVDDFYTGPDKVAPDVQTREKRSGTFIEPSSLPPDVEKWREEAEQKRQQELERQQQQQPSQLLADDSATPPSASPRQMQPESEAAIEKSKSFASRLKSKASSAYKRLSRKSSTAEIPEDFEVSAPRKADPGESQRTQNNRAFASQWNAKQKSLSSSSESDSPENQQNNEQKSRLGL